MFQKFYQDTLEGRFIKNLLEKEEIPLLNCVKDGDGIVEGCFYIFGLYVIECVRTGKLTVNPSEKLFPSDTIYPSAWLFPGTGISIAQFKVIDLFDENSKKQFCYSYHSNTHWYDSDTHKHLGNYLRYLRDYRDLNLMHLYNCYSGYELHDMHLTVPKKVRIHPAETLYPSNAIWPNKLISDKYSSTAGSYKLQENSDYRVIAVPIRFNKKYTIALECSSTVQLRGIIYNTKQGMIPNLSKKNSYYSDDLKSSYVMKSSTSFKKPFIYEIECSDKELLNRERDLHLVIQIPKTVKTTITVLEGDYTRETIGVDNRNEIRCNENSVQIYPQHHKEVHRNLSLLTVNTEVSYAFSDRLIEYLVNNVVTPLDVFPGNIARFQYNMSLVDTRYDSLARLGMLCFGVWDKYIKDAVLRLLDDNVEDYYLVDQDGYMNKQLEDFFTQMRPSSIYHYPKRLEVKEKYDL